MRRYQDGIQKANIHLEDEQRAKDIGKFIIFFSIINIYAKR